MCIYSPKPIGKTTEENFKPTRLYIKKLAGYYYFGKTSLDDATSYHGSGKKWSSIIKKYGILDIKTLWVSDWYYSPLEIQEVALHFSKENSIVESKEWANLRPENGLDGNTIGQYVGEKSPMYGRTGKMHPAYGRKDSELTRKRKSETKMGDNNPMKNPETIKKIKETNKITQRMVGKNNPMFGKKEKDNPNFGQKRPSQSEKMKNKTWKVIDGKRVVSEKTD